MKYFMMLDECKGTCYHEFYKGKWDEKTFWKNDSLYLHDDILFDLKLEEVFYEANSSYDPFNETEINELQWQRIYKMAKTLGGEVFEVINEANEWATKTFKEYGLFTILGI